MVRVTDTGRLENHSWGGDWSARGWLGVVEEAPLPCLAAAAGLLEDELFEALHARGKLVVVLAEGADVPVEHDVDVAAQMVHIRFEFLSKFREIGLRGHVLPDFGKAAGDHLREVVNLPLYVLVFHYRSL